MGKVNTLMRWAEDNPFKCVLGLFLFHLSLSSGLYAIACSHYLAGMHNEYGLWNFSMDSHRFHEWAIHDMKMLEEDNIPAWWYNYPGYPHIRWIGLIYFLFTPRPIAFAPVNALTWVATVVTVYALAKSLMPQSRVAAAMGTAIFSLMPTYLLQTTQLLKDPFYILGIGLILLGVARLLNGKLKWSTMVLASVGMLLAASFRPYMFPILSLLVLMIMIVAIVRVPRSWLPVALAMVVLLGIMCWRIPPIHQTHQVPSTAVHHAESGLTRWLNEAAHSLQGAREKFYGYRKAGSNIDNEVVFQNWTDVLRYMPRALQIGLFSPFPSSWNRPDSSAAWRGARLLAGMEMTIFYLLLVGFVVFTCRGSAPLRLRLCLLVFGLSMVLLLGMAIPNVGIIYRMRYAYLMPMILGGVYGWRMMLIRSRFAFFWHKTRDV